MWESLGSGPRQDRVLHGAAKAFNVALGLVMIPAWIIGQRLVTPLRRLLGRLDPPGTVLPLPPPGQGDLDALMKDLQAIPHRLHPARWALMKKGLADLSMFFLAQKRQTLNLGYAYPSQFEYHYFEGADGERIAASVALHEEPRPGLIVVHGLLSTRLFDYVRAIAVRAYYEWGFNVAAIDLRSFGLTEMMSYPPSTGGWKEGEDIIGAARYLKSLGSTSVGALGISLGASSVMNASHPAGAEALDGGILAICGPGRRAHGGRVHRPRGAARPSLLAGVAAVRDDARLEGPKPGLAQRGRRLQDADGARRRAALRGDGGRDLRALLGQEPHREGARARARAALRRTTRSSR